MLFIPPSVSSLDGSKSSHCAVGDSLVSDTMNSSSLIDSCTSWVCNSIKWLASSIWFRIYKSLARSSFEETRCSSIRHLLLGYHHQTKKSQATQFGSRRQICHQMAPLSPGRLHTLFYSHAQMSASVVIGRMPTFAQDHAIVDTFILFQTSNRMRCTSKRWACFPSFRPVVVANILLDICRSSLQCYTVSKTLLLVYTSTSFVLLGWCIDSLVGEQLYN